MSPDDGSPLERAGRLRLGVGGAESNLAIGLAGLGHRVAWVSRVGDDPFGRMVVREVAGAGVDVDSVAVDPDAPTGVYFKDPRPEVTAVHYYRAGSAASRLDPGALDDPRLAGARLLHLSGITPVLSASCHALVAHAVDARPLGDALVSFDVNHRPRLWPADRAADVLRGIADRADIVLVGLDEAERLWGTARHHRRCAGCCRTRERWSSRTGRSARPRCRVPGRRCSCRRCARRWSNRSAPGTPSPPGTSPPCCVGWTRPPRCAAGTSSRSGPSRCPATARRRRTGGTSTTSLPCPPTGGRRSTR
ncbi:PfkB-family carbohydrate kinase [Micromonospora sp. ATCC 39149]|nr:PfkB-family carbohydrate kinase [Micromonospora sp. ATCC 39149]